MRVGTLVSVSIQGHLVPKRDVRFSSKEISIKYGKYRFVGVLVSKMLLKMQLIEQKLGVRYKFAFLVMKCAIKQQHFTFHKKK